MKLQETENGFQQAVIDYARLMDWSLYHTYDSRRSDDGFPDLVMVRNSDLIIAEVKSETGRLKLKGRTTKSGRKMLSQLEWLEAFAQCPCVEVYLWRPRDWPFIEKRLKHGVSRENLDWLDCEMPAKWA